MGSLQKRPDVPPIKKPDPNQIDWDWVNNKPIYKWQQKESINKQRIEFDSTVFLNDDIEDLVDELIDSKLD